MQTAHRIQRFTIRSRTENQSAAFVLQNQLKASWDTLLPIFEQQFDQLSRNHRTIRIQKLEITLKIDNIDDLKAKLMASLRMELQVELPTELRTQSKIAIVNIENPSATHNSDYSPSPPDSTVSPEEKINQEILFHFLEIGNLPWYARDISNTSDRLREFVSHRSQQVSAWITAHDTPEIISRWLQLIDISKPSIHIIDHLEPLLSRYIDDHPWRELFSAIINNELLSTSNTQKHKILVTLLSTLSTDSHCAANRKNTHPTTTASQVSASLEITEEQWHQWKNYFSNSSPNRIFIKTIIRPLIGKYNHPHSDDNQQKNQKTTTGTIPKNLYQSLSLPYESATSPPAIAVQLAGCILLHPYLGRLFTACNIHHDRNAINPQDLGRAAALLVFATTGNESALDFELTLIKLLLGVTSEDSLFIIPGLLTDNDRTEVETLLISLVKHWSRLKNTSINGLRKSFLRRHGWLRTDQDNLQLHIDRSGADVLIDFLPFSISMVKLPWMPKPLHVNW